MKRKFKSFYEMMQYAQKHPAFWDECFEIPMKKKVPGKLRLLSRKEVEILTESSLWTDHDIQRTLDFLV